MRRPQRRDVLDPTTSSARRHQAARIAPARGGRPPARHQPFGKGHRRCGAVARQRLAPRSPRARSACSRHDHAQGHPASRTWRLLSQHVFHNGDAVDDAFGPGEGRPCPPPGPAPQAGDWARPLSAPVTCATALAAVRPIAIAASTPSPPQASRGAVPWLADIPDSGCPRRTPAADAQGAAGGRRRRPIGLFFSSIARIENRHPLAPGPCVLHLS